MRRLTILFVVLFALTACTTTDEPDDSDSAEPTASPTEQVADDQDSTATPEPTDEAEPDETATPAPSATPDDEEDADDSASIQEQVDEITEQVVELRGLELEEELDFSIMDREELESFLQDEVDIEEGDSDLYWIFRLIEDRGLDLREIMVEAQATDIYGFYDPETEQTYVISDDDEIGVLEEVFVAHELVHALQDQHYDLGQLQTLEPDYDRLMAFRTMVEGDAVLVQQLYAEQYLTEEEMTTYMQEAIGATQNEEALEILESLPRYFLESMSLPYSAGLQFMLQVYDGDFDEVNEVLADPPASSQQTLNPGDYLEGEIEDPVEIELPDFTEQLEGDWEQHRAGTFGVFDLTIMLEENGVTDAQAVLEPWRGSSFAAYIEEDHVLGVLESRWASEEGAAGFEEALVQSMEGYDRQDGVWAGEDRFHTVVTDGDSVTLYSSTDREALMAVAQ